MLYMFIAPGFEEVEAIATADVIRRSGADITLVGIGSKTIKGSHSFVITCDAEESEITYTEDCEGIILPGGMPGTLNLEKNKTVNRFLEKCFNDNKLIASICAAPSIPGHLNMLKGKKAVCFPGFEKDLYGAEITSDYVVKDGNFITAKGMGSAIEFGTEIVSYLYDKENANKLHSTLQCP